MNIRKLLQSVKKFGRTAELYPTQTVKLKKAVYRKTLVLIGRVKSSDGKGVYVSQINFPKISFSTEKLKSKGVVTVKLSGKPKMTALRPSTESTCLVRCNCTDYRFTWWPSNVAAKCHFGKGFPKVKIKGTGTPRNPKQLPGLCKHLVSTMRAARKLKLLS